MNQLDNRFLCSVLVLLVQHSTNVSCNEPLLKTSVKILEGLNRDVDYFYARIEHVKPGVESDMNMIKESRKTFLNLTNGIARSLLQGSKHMRTKIEEVYTLNRHLDSLEKDIDKITEDLRYELAECFPMEKKTCLGRNCYCFYIEVQRPLSWKEARWTCHSIMADLVEVRDEEMNNLITELIIDAANKINQYSIQVWLAGKKQERLNRWTWVASTNETVFWDRGPWESHFAKWDLEASPTYEENCAALDSARGTWFPQLCDTKNVYTLCQRALSVA